MFMYVRSFPDMFADLLLDNWFQQISTTAEDKALRMLLSSGASQAELLRGVPGCEKFP